MRAHTLISILVAGGAVAAAGWGLAAPKPEAVFADKSPSAIPVDVELVIAVDVSNSMDPEEQALQREGAAQRRPRPHRHHVFRMGRPE